MNGPLIVIFRSKRDSVQNSFPNHTKPRTPSTSTPSRLIQTWSRKSWTRSYLRFSKTGRADLWTTFTSQLRRMYVENAEEEKHASSHGILGFGRPIRTDGPDPALEPWSDLKISCSQPSKQSRVPSTPIQVLVGSHQSRILMSIVELTAVVRCVWTNMLPSLGALPRHHGNRGKRTDEFRRIVRITLYSSSTICERYTTK